MISTLMTLALIAPIPQEPPTTGLFQNLPIVTMEEAGTGDLLYAEPGSLPAPLDATNPYASINSLIPAAPKGLNKLRISSFSRGTGALYSRLSESGEVQLDLVWQDAWGMVLFTVGGTDWPQGSIYEDEALGNGVVGDVFAYVMPGGETHIPDDQVGLVHKVWDGKDLSLGALVDIDSFIPDTVLAADHADESEVELGGGEVSFYFTLVGDDLADYTAIPSSWDDLSAGSIQCPATIFRATYTPGSGWAVQVEAKSNALGLAPTEVIDGLTVMGPNFIGGPWNSPGIRYLLSTTAADLDLQLWAVGSWKDSQNSALSNRQGPLHDESGGPFVTTRIGLTGPAHEIRGICAEDPYGDLTAPVTPRHDLRRERTALWESARPGSYKLDIALHQLEPLNTQSSHYYAALRGVINSQDQAAVLYCGLNGQAPQRLLTVARDPSQPGGDKVTGTFTLPRRTGGPEEVWFWWEVHDSSRNVVGTSHMLKMMVR